jgi:hypothetical protein
MAQQMHYGPHDGVILNSPRSIQVNLRVSF